MTIIRVVGANLDTERLTLYKEDGTTLEILQGDPRLRDILKKLDVITEPGIVAEIDLGGEVDINHYKAFEEQSSGIVKLFRVAKKFVKHIFAEPEQPRKIGDTSGRNKTQSQILETTQEQIIPAPKPTAFSSAADEIMAHAEPVSAEGFDHTTTTDDQTIIAVVQNDTGKKTIIPEAEKLKGQFGNAAKLGSTKGVENLLKRLGAVIDQRAHSVQDVLTFLERADLPIADDGSIVAYKVLKTRTEQDRRDRVFVDCHTGKVVQRVGSYVCMDPSLVDHNRRQECSNGLHIARRGYLGIFSGDVIVITKVAPEDVIAVPHGDPNKVRVCGYHILGEIPKDQHANLRSHRPMTNNETAAKLLGAVISGNHIGKIEEVRITEGYGGGVVITPMVDDKKVEKEQAKQAKEAVKAAEPVHAINVEDPKAPKQTAPTIDPKKVAEKVAKTKNAPETRQAKARRLFLAKDATALLDLKKTSKVGWDKLGISPAELKLIESDFAGTEPVKAPPAQVEQTKAQPKGKPPVQKKKTGTVEQTMAELNDKKEPPKMTGTRSEIARQHFNNAIGGDKASWGHLWVHAKQAKIGWDRLGFTPKEIERIKTNKPDWI